MYDVQLIGLFVSLTILCALLVVTVYIQYSKIKILRKDTKKLEEKLEETEKISNNRYGMALSHWEYIEKEKEQLKEENIKLKEENIKLKEENIRLNKKIGALFNVIAKKKNCGIIHGNIEVWEV